VHIVDDLSGCRRQNVARRSRAARARHPRRSARGARLRLRPEVVLISRRRRTSVPPWSGSRSTRTSTSSARSACSRRHAPGVPGLSSRRPAERSTASARVRARGGRTQADLAVRDFEARRRGVPGDVEPGDRKQTRDFVYVGDVVEAMLAAASAPAAGVFNAAEGRRPSSSCIRCALRL